MPLKRCLFSLRAAAFLVALCSALYSAPRIKAAEYAGYYDTFFGQNATSPGTPTPWVTTTIRDGLSAGTVFITVSNSSLLLPSAKLDEATLNFNPNLNISSLSFTLDSSVGLFTAPTILTGTNAFQANGDGKYDIKLDFIVGMQNASFAGGESITYKVTGISTLTADDFIFLSAPGGNTAGPFYMAGHLQGLGQNGNKSAFIAPSGIVAVPEPAPLALFALGIGLLLIEQSGRRKTRRLR